MRRITTQLNQVKRTEHKDWKTSKVKNLTLLLDQDKKDFVDQPVYVVKRRYKPDEYLVYDGNTRHFLAEHGVITISTFHLIETDSDLELVRELMQDIYWPGENLSAVTGTLSSRRYYLKQTKTAA